LLSWDDGVADGVEVSAAAAAAWHCELELLIPVSVRVAALRGLLLGRRLDMRGGPHLGVPGLRLQQVERRRGAEQLAGALPGRDSLRDAALGRSSRLCEDPAAWRRCQSAGWPRRSGGHTTWGYNLPATRSRWGRAARAEQEE